MSNQFFHGAPDLSRDFHAKSNELRPVVDATNWTTRDDLDHLDLASLDYTPGGHLEYATHKAVRRQREGEQGKLDISKIHDEQPLNFSHNFQCAAGSREGSREQLSKEELLRNAIQRDLSSVCSEDQAQSRKTRDRDLEH